MNREEKKEYDAFVRALKKFLKKGALVSISGLNEKDQQFFDASFQEPGDGAFCD